MLDNDHSLNRKEASCFGAEGSNVWQETLLGGALQFLAEIGEDIRVHRDRAPGERDPTTG